MITLEKTNNSKNLMYEEIMENLKVQLTEQNFKKLQTKRLHLGIFTEPYLTYILNGQKTIESRFSKKKSIPYQKITKDDIVIIKKSSGNVLAYFTIKEVLFFDLNNTTIEEIKKTYGKQLCVDETFWIQKKNSKFATLLIIDDVINLKPFAITKKGMQTWIILNEKVNYKFQNHLDISIAIPIQSMKQL